jgi:hypothetical protein
MPPIETIALYAGYLLAIATALGVVVRWIFLPLFIRPLLSWYRDTRLVPELDTQLQPIRDDLAQTLHLVRFHLGSNGTTPPLRDRVLALEVDASAVKDDVREIRDDLKSRTTT